jgi:hypothetical protein
MKRWQATAVAIAVVLTAAVALGGVRANESYCVGDCRGAIVQCTAITDWILDIEERQDPALRSRTYRLRSGFREGAAARCAPERWWIYPEDAGVTGALERAERDGREVMLSLRYTGHRNSDVRSPDEMGLEVIGVETRGTSDWRAMIDGRAIRSP